MDHTWLAGNMRIGSNVFISGGVLTANDNAFGNTGYENNMHGPNIDDHAKIGVGAILLPQITVGEGALVAGGSVVTRNVMQYSTVKGTPAKRYTK